MTATATPALPSLEKANGHAAALFAEPRKSSIANRLADRANEAAKRRFKIMTSAELDAANFETPAFIEDCFYYGYSPLIIGGMYKSYKTLLAIELAISLSAGRPFLNKFAVPQKRPVAYFSGEGGFPMLQDYSRRVAMSKGISLANAGVYWSDKIVRFEDKADLEELKIIRGEIGCEIAVFDNLMLAMRGDDAGNVFQMGGVIGKVIETCTTLNISPVFVHHYNRTAGRKAPAPGDLSGLTQAGAAECAGQWMLVTHRKGHNPGPGGEGKITIAIGGRHGAGNNWDIDVHEGKRSDEEMGGGRFWGVDVTAYDDGSNDHGDHDAPADADVLTKKDQELLAVCGNIIEHARDVGPATKNTHRDYVAKANGVGNTIFQRAWARLTEDNKIMVEHGTVTAGNGQDYPAWVLNDDYAKDI